MRFGALFCKTVGAVELEVFANLGHYKYFFYPRNAMPAQVLEIGMCL